ncbi:MAG: hypothetical protein OEV42_07480 [Deltaproteobacteria bacterium]|nr:hypothetical protein [Deltaproteobacteria bacterium]
MVDLFITFFSLFSLWLLGLNFMVATGLRQSNNQLLSTMAVEFCIGTGLLYLLLFTSSLFTGHLAPFIVYILLLLLIIFNLFRKGKLHFKRDLLPDKREAAGLLLTGCLFLLLFLPSLHKGLEWDAWAIWAFKAKAFYVDGKISNPFLADLERYAYSHPDYPLLIPLTEYWIYFHLGHINDHVVRLVPLAFWICMLLFFYSTLLEHMKTWTALLMLILLSFIWPITDNVLMSSADAIQAFYNLAGIVCLFNWIEKDEKAYFRTGAIILALGMNVKNEGLAFWASTASALLLLSVIKATKKGGVKQFYSFISFALTGTLVSVIWIMYKNMAGIGSELFSKGIPSPGTMIERSGEIVLFYLEQIINTGYPGWGLLWIFMALALLKMFTCGDLKRKAYQFYLATCFFHILSLFAIYCITPYDLGYHIQTSGDRTLLQLVPALFWIGAISLFSEQNRLKGNHCSR